jgi:hypothetical protein
MRRLILALSLVALPCAVGACKLGGAKKADPVAQEACKTSAKDADSCKLCCNNAGGSGYMYQSGAGCKCL